jgi:hypothetical protein
VNFPYDRKPPLYVPKRTAMCSIPGDSVKGKKGTVLALEGLLALVEMDKKKKNGNVTVESKKVQDHL